MQERTAESHRQETPSLYDFYDYSTFWQGRDYESRADIIAFKKFLNKIRHTIPHDCIIDVGGGLGRLTPHYAPHFTRPFLVDPSSVQLERSQKTTADAYPHVSFLQGTAENLPFPDASTDVVVCVRVSHHIPDMTKPIEEFSRVLKPGGYLILEIANKLHIKSRLRAYAKGGAKELHSLAPMPVRMYKDTVTPFVNHHPQAIETELIQAGFDIVTRRSVSNLRSPLLKKIAPTCALVGAEYILQRMLAHWQFGPSVFFLARKK